MQWPPKVRDDFPLTIVPRGYMAWLGGKTRWVCGKKPPLEALKIYHRKALEYATPDSKPMPTPSVASSDAATLHYIFNRWLLARRTDVEEGKIKPHTFGQYTRSAKAIDKLAGHYKCTDWTPEHTEEIHRRLLKDRGADFARRAMNHLRDCCRYAAERRWCRPVLYGEKIISGLAARPRPQMQWRLYTPAEIRRIIAAAKSRCTAKPHQRAYVEAHEQFYAMLLLALNGGLGSQELADLPKTAIDLKAAMLRSVRGKTGVRHIVPLWKETVDALKPVLAQRAGDELLFRTRAKNPWCYQRPKMKAGKIVGTTSNDNTADHFNELVAELGLKVKGQSFYKLKHLSNTIADGAGDVHATFAIYGHSLGVKGHYVRVDEFRLRKVAEHVRHVLLHS